MRIEIIGLIADAGEMSDGGRGLVVISEDQTLTLIGLSEGEARIASDFTGQKVRMTVEVTTEGSKP